MRCQPLETAGLRVLIVDDFYDPDELDAVKAEALKLSVFGRAPESAGAAVGRKRGKAIILDRLYEDIFRNREASAILGAARKLSSGKVVEAAIALDASYRHLVRHDSQFSILNFYGDGDYYGPHTDNCVLTSVVMFGLGKVDGGGLLFEEYQERIPYRDNRCVIFPGAVLHAAEPVVADPGSRRCSVATFFRYA